jgi:transcriptional regulator with XRE-family HTH domain
MHIMQQIPRQLQRLMEEKAWTQQQVAKHAGVHQSTVCRMLKAPPTRMGRSQQKVIALLQSNAYSTAAGTPDFRNQVLNAFENVWDGSVEHAEAIIAVLSRLPILRLKEKQNKGEALARDRR